MKKIAAILFGMAALAGVTAQAQETTDSLSYYMGATQGAMINRQIGNMGIMDQSYRSGLLRGLETVLCADTTDLGFLEGLQIGLAMSRDMVQIGRLGGKIDRKVFYNELARVVNSGKFDNEQYSADAQALARYMEPIQQRYNEQKQKADAEAEASSKATEALVEANEKAGKAFIDSLVKADKNVKVTKSGLAYKVIRKGNGAKPGPEDGVRVRYVGRTIDGNEFDRSGDAPAEFNRRGVIQGFSEGLGLMNKGAKYELYIPANLGYGIRGAGDKIAPGATLIFEVELEEVLH